MIHTYGDFPASHGFSVLEVGPQVENHPPEVRIGSSSSDFLRCALLKCRKMIEHVLIGNIYCVSLMLVFVLV